MTTTRINDYPSKQTLTHTLCTLSTVLHATRTTASLVSQTQNLHFSPTSPAQKAWPASQAQTSYSLLGQNKRHKSADINSHSHTQKRHWLKETSLFSQ